METKVLLCKCGAKACICEDCDLWAAHCTRCDNTIGISGYYSPVAKSEQEAIERWNKLNGQLHE